MFQTKVAVRMKTHITFSKYLFFSENRAVYEIKWGKKYGRAGRATDDNMTQALCMLDK